MKDVARLLPIPEWSSADLRRLSAGSRKIARRKMATKVVITCALCLLGVAGLVVRPTPQKLEGVIAKTVVHVEPKKRHEPIEKPIEAIALTPARLDTKTDKQLGLTLRQKRAATQAKTSQESLDAAEAALARRDYMEAERIFKTISGPDAALATFMLGKLYQDRLFDPTRALAAFERVSPTSPLAEDALHRQIACLHALARTGEALLREQRYRAASPNGVLIKR